MGFAASRRSSNNHSGSVCHISQLIRELKNKCVNLNRNNSNSTGNVLLLAIQNKTVSHFDVFSMGKLQGKKSILINIPTISGRWKLPYKSCHNVQFLCGRRYLSLQYNSLLSLYNLNLETSSTHTESVEFEDTLYPRVKLSKLTVSGYS